MFFFIVLQESINELSYIHIPNNENGWTFRYKINNYENFLTGVTLNNSYLNVKIFSTVFKRLKAFEKINNL